MSAAKIRFWIAGTVRPIQSIERAVRFSPEAFEAEPVDIELPADTETSAILVPLGVTIRRDEKADVSRN